MAIPFEHRNFHKELEKMAQQLKAEERLPHCFFIVVVHLAAVVV